MTKLKLILLLLVLASMAFAQPTRTVVLTWEDNANPAGTTYTVYRADGQCTGTPNYSSVASGIAIKTYSDAGRSPGKYCYTVTASYNGEESEYAVPAMAQVRPWKPTNVQVEVR